VFESRYEQEGFHFPQNGHTVSGANPVYFKWITEFLAWDKAAAAESLLFTFT
jgi:hypothetical protein